MKKSSTSSGAAKPSGGRIVPSRYMQSKPSVATKPASNSSSSLSQVTKEKPASKEPHSTPNIATANVQTSADTVTSSDSGHESVETLQYKLLQSAYLNAITKQLSDTEFMQNQKGLTSAFWELQELKTQHETLLKRVNQIKNYEIMKQTISDMSELFSSGDGSSSLCDQVAMFAEQIVEFSDGYRSALSRLSARNFEITDYDQLRKQVSQCVDLMSSLSGKFTSDDTAGKSHMEIVSELAAKFDSMCQGVLSVQNTLERLHGDLEHLFVAETKYKALTL